MDAEIVGSGGNGSERQAMDAIDVVAAKLARGERLNEADALALFESPDLQRIGQLANGVNRQRNKDVVFYNVNRHINPTNICALSCKFCAYSRKPGEEGAYAYSIDEMVKKAGEAVAQGATEVHMVGGLHPRWKFDHYKDMIKAVKDAYPHVHIKAFTAVELDWLARRARLSIEEVLQQLVAVGLGSLPGGGAEIFHPEIRDAICDTKVSAEQWLDTHRTAHRLGLHSNCTMLYGHIENYSHRVDHMRRLRELQDETHGFNAFIPLSFQPFQNEMGIDSYTFGFDDLKTLAIARLYLDNFQHIKAYWIMLGQDVAQLALHYGANDLDGTVIEEKISRMAGGRAGMAMSRHYIENLIVKSGRIPTERDTLYNAVPRSPSDPVVTLDKGSQLPVAAGAAAAALAKAAAGELLNHGDLLALASDAPLHELAAAAIAARPDAAGMTGSFAPVVLVPVGEAQSIGAAVEAIEAQSEACIATYRLAPTKILLDLSGPAADLGLLLELVWACSHRFPEREITVRGLKSLWRLAQEEGTSISELLGRLKEAGLGSVESSPAESETDLTHGEVANLLRQVQRADIVTAGKAELSAPVQGAGAPLWDSYLKRIAVFTDLASKSSKFMTLSIEASPGSFLTPAEYLRAVALARLAAPTVPAISAPLAAMPVLSPHSGAGSAKFQHAAEKIAALALHFGASDLGAIDVAKLNPVAVMKQIRSTGYEPLLQEAQVGRAVPALPYANHAAAEPNAPAAHLRHVPQLVTVS